MDKKCKPTHHHRADFGGAGVRGGEGDGGVSLKYILLFEEYPFEESNSMFNENLPQKVQNLLNDPFKMTHKTGRHIDGNIRIRIS